MYILIIDDEPAIRQVLAAAVRRGGHSVETASGVKEAAARLVRGDVDVALCDIHMPDGNGLDLVKAMKESGIETQFVMVTAFASLETAVQALKFGASDYITKPVNSEELLHRIGLLSSLRGLRDQNKALQKIVSAQQGPDFRFKTGAMAEVDRLIGKVAATESTVLITGESGTGKGVAARSLHDRSARHDGVFLPVNCGAIPDNLIESEFFGHLKGAFTGADRARKGLFLEAEGGTLFLDEIGELPIQMQAKLLHAIEQKEIRQVGSESQKKTDVRIVAATNRNLEELVRDGKFREDLYFRLSVFHIPLPPLRERRGDLPALIDHVMHRLSSEQRRVLTLDPEAKQVLLDYRWPGNLRELSNVLGRAAIICEGDLIAVGDLPSFVCASGEDKRPSSLAGEGQTMRTMVRHFEASLIRQALQDCAGDRRAAAQRLGIGLSSLYRKIEEYASEGLLENDETLG